MSSGKTIHKRKSQHIKYALDPRSQSGINSLERVSFPYTAMPDKSLSTIDLSTVILGKKISYPFFISCMTGGPQKAGLINTRLAKAAQRYNIPMGLGSFRIALKYPELIPTFQVRDLAPSIPLFTNLGASSLNDGLTWKDCQKAVDITQADALVLHLNPLQEALQSGGNTDFANLLPKIETVVQKLNVPVIVKEVGHGIDYHTAYKLFNIGIMTIDTAGTGGTSWSWIEAKIAGNERQAEIFKNLGISTYESILACKKIKGLTVFASGGIRTGLDIARALYMGCLMAGIARPFLVAALSSEDALDDLIRSIIWELKVSDFCRVTSG